MVRFIAILFLSLLPLGAEAQMTVDTSLANRTKLYDIYTRYGVRWADFSQFRSPGFQPRKLDASRMEYRLVKSVWEATRSIPSNLVVYGSGYGATQQESVNTALEDLCLRLGTRVRTSVQTTNSNGHTSLSSKTLTDAGFVLPAGATSIHTKRIRRKEYYTEVSVDISAYLAGVEEKIARLHHHICITLSQMSFKSEEDRKTFVSRAWNGYLVGVYILLDNPISDGWSIGQSNQERKDACLSLIDPRYAIMYTSPDRCDPYRVLPKVYPCTFRELDAACNREREMISHLGLPMNRSISIGPYPYSLKYTTNHHFLSAEQRLKSYGWKVVGKTK
ncbi:MAG: hypothetical protein J6T04_03490 [Bacteroidales bacterium]|nr:hypothetical protein [Bacteroidales bacterium]